jgi:hypothetical protein
MSASQPLRAIIAAYNAELTDLDIGLRHYADAVAELNRALPEFAKSVAPAVPHDRLALVKDSLKHARVFISRTRNEPVLAHIERFEAFVTSIEASLEPNK